MAKGKTYRSKFAGFNGGVRPESKHVHPATGLVVSTTKRLGFDFAKHGPEYDYTDAEGRVQKASDIRGHFFNTGSAQEEFGWTDDEREAVEQALDRWCQRWPEAVWEVSAAKAGKPWPKYDETHHNQIPVLAEQLGFVAEALQYEVENKNRSGVVEKLNEILAAAAEAAVVEDSLTAS